MASEDSAEHLIDRTTTLLAIVIHGVRHFDDGRQPTGLTMQATLEEVHRIFEQLHIGASR